MLLKLKDNLQTLDNGPQDPDRGRKSRFLLLCKIYGNGAHLEEMEIRYDCHGWLPV
jgi:hypothetical protein